MDGTTDGRDSIEMIETRELGVIGAGIHTE